METATATRPRRRRRTREQIEADERQTQPAAQSTIADFPLRATATATAPDRDDMRPDMRPDQRGETSRQEAERLGREILERTQNLDTDFHDDFSLAAHGVEPPDGWEYQWKRRLLVGKEEPGYEVALQLAGWRAVPAGRHPELMPKQGHFEVIERGGQILMECPKIVTEEQRIRERRKAMDRMDINARRLGQPAPGTPFARNGNAVGRDPVINKTYEPMVLPERAAKA